MTDCDAKIDNDKYQQNFSENMGDENVEDFPIDQSYIH